MTWGPYLTGNEETDDDAQEGDDNKYAESETGSSFEQRRATRPVDQVQRFSAAENGKFKIKILIKLKLKYKNLLAFRRLETAIIGLCIKNGWCGGVQITPFSQLELQGRRTHEAPRSGATVELPRP